MLTDIGFFVSEATNGHEAITACAEWQPHLILMDMRMPEMDGYEATRRIKATPAGHHIPIIALTASAFEEDRAAVLAAGCDAFLRKPFQINDLCALIEQFLGVTFAPASADPTPTTHQAEPREAPAPLAPAMLHQAATTLPPNWIHDLQRLLILGDVQALRQMIQPIQPTHPALANHLLHLLKMYHFDEMEALLAQIATSHTET
jgi:CheY-like chemotaxis protein